jgi:hemerythrin-like domain-containing protein
MKTTDLLMAEHRLIERILRLLQEEGQVAEAGEPINTALIDTIVDFIRWYADKTHHGKEEAILFKDASSKEILPEDRTLMQELIEDHIFGRRTTGSILEAKERYVLGSGESLKVLSGLIERLVGFYHEHIRKEDHVFFPALTKYFSTEEQEAMLLKFNEADGRMIHARYLSYVEQLEKR